MDLESARLLAAGLCIGLGAIGPGIGIGMVGNGAVQAVARNPDAKGNIFTYMLFSIALSEACVIYALVFTIMILFVL